MVIVAQRGKAGSLRAVALVVRHHSPWRRLGSIRNARTRKHLNIVKVFTTAPHYPNGVVTIDLSVFRCVSHFINFLPHHAQTRGNRSVHHIRVLSV